MREYIRLYHYSSTANLTTIDPIFYGTGATRGTEMKSGSKGLNKSYFYFRDEPETCIIRQYRYEAFMPAHWKQLIYDRSVDPLNLYDSVYNHIKMSVHRAPYQCELKDGVEAKIQELGFKGWMASKHDSLSHVIILFEAMSTMCPMHQHVVMDWAGAVQMQHQAASLIGLFSHQLSIATDQGDLSSNSYNR